MANVKSAEKRWRQSLVRRARNRTVRGAVRTFVRDSIKGLHAGAADADSLQKAIIALDKAAEKGILHKNNAARRKSRLMSQFAVVAAGGTLPPINRLPSRRSGRATTAARGPRRRR